VRGRRGEEKAKIESFLAGVKGEKGVTSFLLERSKHLYSK